MSGNGDYISREALRDALYEADAITMKGVAIINQFPAADVRPKWISVEERLPKEPGEYIVFIRDPFHAKDEPQDEFNVDASYVTSCFYDKDAGLWREWDNSYYCANLQCVNTNKMYYISHWMPLPEPPKEEN